MPDIFGVFGIFLIALVSWSRGEPDQICPMNEVVLPGQDIELQFETVKPLYFVNWLEYTDSVNGRTVFLNGTNIFSDQERAARFGLTHTLGSPDDNDTSVYHTFHVYDCTTADAGKYCALEFIDSVFHWAEVIVLERNIDCVWGNRNASISDQLFTGDDVISVTCSIPYRGKWAPVFACSGANFDNFTAVNLTTDVLASYSFTAIPQVGTPSGSVDCDARFVNPTPVEYTHGYATNVPTYTSTWQSPTLKIYYPATMISMSPVLLVYDVGDVVRCMATKGNPAPVYKWLEADGNETLSKTPFLRFSAEMAGTTVDAVCIAETTIRGTVYELSANMSFRVNEMPTTTPSVVLTSPETTTRKGGQTGSGGADTIDNAVVIIIIVSVIAGLLAIALIVVITLFCVKKVSKEDDERI